MQVARALATKLRLERLARIDILSLRGQRVPREGHHSTLIRGHSRISWRKTKRTSPFV